ncbi:carbohydrate ABC transporter permease [Ruminococcaceae bacterium OttesenSCG-928-L11]|nr:carbohydrate ABC transporter permease [Ruminococcaceae bacterium OttesenSCG-928-L11]
MDTTQRTSAVTVPKSQRLSYRTRKTIGRVLYHIFVILIGFVMIYPLIWMVASSFKPPNEIFNNAKSLIPNEFVTYNYPNGWKGFAGYSFSNFFKNSFVISGIATLGSLISSPFIAFGFARLRFKGKKLWFSMMLLTMMLPFQIIMIPQYIIYHNLGWVGTILPLVIPNFFGGAFFIFLIIQFIDGIPRELDEAAKIDGCSWYGIYTRIILPLIVPAIVTCGIFSFMWKWDDFLASLLYLNAPRQYTVSIALKMFSDPNSGSDWGSMFAMATLSILPIMLIFIFCQKYLVEGISTEGLKG